MRNRMAAFFRAVKIRYQAGYFFLAFPLWAVLRLLAEFPICHSDGLLPAHLRTLLFHLGQSRVHLLYNFAHCPSVYIHSCGGRQKILFGYILALVVDHAGLFPVNAL